MRVGFAETTLETASHRIGKINNVEIVLGNKEKNMCTYFRTFTFIKKSYYVVALFFNRFVTYLLQN